MHGIRCMHYTLHFLHPLLSICLSTTHLLHLSQSSSLYRTNAQSKSSHPLQSQLERNILTHPSVMSQISQLDTASLSFSLFLLIFISFPLPYSNNTPLYPHPISSHPTPLKYLNSKRFPQFIIRSSPFEI